MKQQNIIDEAEVFIAKERIVIPDGKHSGQIIDIRLNKTSKDGSTYAYIDLWFELEDMKEKPTIKIGLNANISDTSQLGMLMQKAGFDFHAGDEISFGDIKMLFIGKNATFKTMGIEKNIQGSRIEFFNIVYETIEFEEEK